MKNLTLILLLAISPALYAQTEAQKDTVHLMKEPLRFDEKLDYSLKPDYSPAIGKSVFPVYEPLKAKNTESIDLKLPPLNVYLGPPLENNTFTRYPFANDYSFVSEMIISDRAWLTSSSRQFGYPTLGAIRSVGVNFNYMPADWLTVSVGPYGSKYNFYGLNNNDVGVNGSLKFRLTDRISINGYGQYSAFADQNKVYGPLMNMYPSTYYGGTLELKITEKFGIEGGIIRELNPFSGKWENRPYLAPVFYTK
ncbi:hypothetical protein FACS1894169_05360 [Bacteroidia bacterium]|nr:hypothetical protein FACS1894169_05360 [Bacteroidia bacterium]